MRLRFVEQVKGRMIALGLFIKAVSLIEDETGDMFVVRN